MTHGLSAGLTGCPDSTGSTVVMPAPDISDLPVDAPGGEPALADFPDGEETSSPDLPAETRELVDLIREEIIHSTPRLDHWLDEAESALAVGHPPMLTDYREQLERLASAAGVLGLTGLSSILQQVGEAAAAADAPVRIHLLRAWPALVLAYLDRVGDREACTHLIRFACDEGFPRPLEAEHSGALLEQLRHPDLESGRSAGAERPHTAGPDDVSLDLPGDLNPQLLGSLLEELPAHTQELSATIQRLIAGPDGVAQIAPAQRIAHTLKGSANTVGIRGIANIAHHMEDILTALADAGAVPPPLLAEVLVRAADCLEAMSEALLDLGAAPDGAVETLQILLDWANWIDANEISSDAHQPWAPVAGSMADIAAVPAPAPAPASASASASKESHSEALSNAPTLRVTATRVDNLLRLAGEAQIVSGQLKDGLSRVNGNVQSMRRQHLLFQQLVNELEHLVDIRGAGLPAGGARTHGDFDPLELDQYNELHTVTRRLVEAAADAREWSHAATTEISALEHLLINQKQQTSDTQEAILQMRMVAASTIVGRLQRAVRQTCRTLDREVELTIEGGSTLIDSDTLAQLVDPLVHLLRNAIDHGIEPGEQRLAAGKPARGSIEVRFGREGNQIVVTCADDGAGLDLPAIRAKAIERGLIEESADPGDLATARLILEPGFSTRSGVTQVSGRGIGLDMVKGRVLDLKGSLEIHTERHRGCRFSMRLPATLLSAHALLVRHAGRLIAIANRGIRQILDAQSGRVTWLGDRLALQAGDEIHEAHLLGNVLGAGEGEIGAPAACPALLMQADEDRICAILVPEVVHTVDLVMKPLGDFAPKPPGIVGLTILGNGAVASVIDLPDLFRANFRSGQRPGKTSAAHKHSSAGSGSRKADAVTARSRPLQALVVDDSLSVRRSMEQLLHDAGYDVLLARDGMDAVGVLESHQPDIVLVDLEMPRMNGMELTTHIRNRPATRTTPVIMITSRSTEKHRQQALAVGVNHYLTKPYDEDVLLAQMERLLGGRA